MKKLFSLLAILMVAMTAWADAITAVQPTEGNGKSSNPYKIATAANLVWFAQQVNGGQISICGKLTADIDLGDDQTMIGTSTNKYKGTFNGDKHCVTINYIATENNTALFRYVNDATINNLMTAGSITTGYQCAGGIVAESYNHTYINKCVSSVVITSTFAEKKVGKHGGIVANNCFSVDLKDVLFNGKLLGENATDCGGLIGETEMRAWIENCLFCPSEVTFNTSNASTLSDGYAGYITVKNSYYSTPLGRVQGTETIAEEVASGKICYKLNGGETGGSQAWYQNLDNGQTKDAAPVPFNTHGTVFFTGEDYCPANTYTNSNALNNHSFGNYDEDGIAHCGNTGCNAVKFRPAEQDASGTYLIAKSGNLVWFAQQVNAGQTTINGKLTADIDLGDLQTMIGTSTNKYAGTFDGDGHTVTVNYNTSENFTALFRYVGTATIKNLMTSGTITTSGKQAAGVVGMAESLTLERIISNVTINSSYSGDSSDAGLVAEISSTSTITNCAFVGKLLGAKTSNCGGLIGWEGNADVTITNCYVNIAEQTVSADGSKTLARYSSTAPTITNCYYVTALGDAQGSQIEASTVKDGSLVASLGHRVWVQDAIFGTPVPFRQVKPEMTDLLEKYLKFTAQGDGTITINQKGTVTATLHYLTDEVIGWTDVVYGTPIPLTEGQSIWMCAKGNNGKNGKLGGDSNGLTFTSTMDVAASQNIMSLLDASCEQTSVPAFGFYKLFLGWSHLTQAPELPATELDSYCYESMFENCTSLTTAPDISHARTVDSNAKCACRWMFKGCSNIKFNNLGLGSEWIVNIEDEYGAGDVKSNTYQMFFNAGGNYPWTPEKGVAYYIYNDEPYTRSMANEWGTVVLPFDVAYDATNTNHKLYHLTAADSKNLSFTEYAAGTIAAGTPMVVKAIGDKGSDDKYAISIPSAKGKFKDAITEQNSENASLPEGWTMKGTYSNLTDQTGIYYIASNKFWYAEEPITIAPFRAWFTGPVTSGAKAFNIVIDDATGISEIRGESLELRDGKLLENGRVVIVKNGKKYNTAGQAIR